MSGRHQFHYCRGMATLTRSDAVKINFRRRVCD